MKTYCRIALRLTLRYCGAIFLSCLAGLIIGAVTDGISSSRYGYSVEFAVREGIGFGVITGLFFGIVFGWVPLKFGFHTMLWCFLIAMISALSAAFQSEPPIVWFVGIGSTLFAVLICVTWKFAQPKSESTTLSTSSKLTMKNSDSANLP